MSDYNHIAFIAEFENLLSSMGFQLKKIFDDSNKGGRFFFKGQKNKAAGRYKYVEASLTKSGNPMIMWTLFEIKGKDGKVTSGSVTDYFWYVPADGIALTKRNDENIKEYEKNQNLKREAEKNLQKMLSKKAQSEYLDLIDKSRNPDTNRYLKRKNVKASRGVYLVRKDFKVGSHYNQFKKSESDYDFYYIKKDDLIAPAMNLDLEFVTYQRTTPDGGKYQRIDISTVGAFHCIGVWRKNTVRIYLVEGYATGYTLYRVTDGVVFVCFDVNNIGVLAKQLSERFPFIEFIICTDNDRKKTTKVGLFKGFEYSYRYNKPFIFPKFPSGAEYDDLSDWNDLATVELDSDILIMLEKQISYFHLKGKNHCIRIAAKEYGISDKDLILHKRNDEELFKTLELIDD
ncbi:hypothetical protein AMD27_16665 (plasmid) [Acinetobacter sp. TGL-Y2]|uniref:hypothetical protein n=1 Tax=Acinetobacter sp. TGL-Y2 TaxID=1407071 RepID=UPI0007A64520|nr:hypothetical protein [Acinetobacter sp. TGL-Y2]AMW80549.1 hypothetical protein AMD27_16665 [Acinetobacter sp. TGL-Y2]